MTLLKLCPKCTRWHTDLVCEKCGTERDRLIEWSKAIERIFANKRVAKFNPQLVQFDPLAIEYRQILRAIWSE